MKVCDALLGIAVALVPTLTYAQSTSARTKEDCLRAYKKAEAAGIVYGVRDGSIIVDEATWNRISFETKVGMAETIGCAAVGPGKTIPLTFRSNLSDRVLGEYGVFGLKVLP
jgi:hypothetical protein